MLPAAITLFDSGIDGIADGAVERGHEVRDEPRLVEAEQAAVQALELLGKVRGRETVHLEEPLEQAHAPTTSCSQGTSAARNAGSIECPSPGDSR